MKKPNLSEIAQFAEVIAAVAVVISLVYVGREIQSNAAAVRAASVEGMARASGELLLTAASDSALSRMWQVGNRDVTLLSDAEAFRHALLTRQALLTLQNAYFQNELNVLEPRVWEGYHRIVCELSSNQGFQDTWHLHRNVLDDGFATMVDACSAR